MSSLQPALVLAHASSGLASLGVFGRFDSQGRLIYGAERPGPDWHAHGSFIASYQDLQSGRLVRLQVVKPRFLHRRTRRTMHVAPPDDIGLRYSALVVAISVWCWLDAAVGLHRFTNLIDELDGRPSPRSIHRWYARYLPDALRLQQAIRRVLVERCEPRPVERLFPGGLPPPLELRRGAWRDPDGTWTLHRALAMLLGGAIGLELPVASLLAEMRRTVETDCSRNG